MPFPTRPSASAARDSGNITVRSFGAVGDGEADDGPAFNAALDVLDSTGGTLIVPAGSYRIATPVSLTLTAQQGPRFTIEGFGSASRIIPDTGASADCVSLTSASTMVPFIVRGLTFTGPGNGVAQCKRALRLNGSDFSSHRVESCTFAGVSAVDSIVSFGTGSVHLVEHCDWIGCQTTGGATTKRALLDFDYIFGAHVRDCRMLASGYINGTQILGGGARYGIKFRRFEIPLGTQNASQILIERCLIFANVFFGVACFQHNGQPNGPITQVYTDRIASGTPGTVTVSGTPTGTLPFTVEVEIRSTGAAGVATWRHRLEPNGYGQGFGAWSADISASSAAIGNGVTVTLGAGTFTQGNVYYFYGTGKMRWGQVTARSVTVLQGGSSSENAFAISECDRVLLEQCKSSTTNVHNAVDLWDCDTVEIVGCDFGANRVLANAAAFGYGANNHVRIHESTCAINASSAATSIQRTVGGVEAEIENSDGAIAVNLLVKRTATGIVKLADGDAGEKCLGALMEAASGANQKVRVVEKRGQVVTLITDGSSTAITAGDPLYNSGAVGAGGKVVSGGAGRAVAIARASNANSSSVPISAVLI